MKERSFLDSNILVYTDDSNDLDKQKRALALIKSGGESRNAILSTQVLQEYFSASTRKLKTPVETVQRKIELLSKRLEIYSISTEDISAAIDLHRLHSFSFWDSLIIRMAQKSNCSILYSEDMQNGRQIGCVKIINPFSE